MIRLSKDKVDERFNISDEGVITDLQGNVQHLVLHKGRYEFHGICIYKILMWTRYGWRDGNIWHIHHIDKNPSNNNINNLVYLTKGEHTKLHSTGKHWKMSEETKQKISEIFCLELNKKFQIN